MTDLSGAAGSTAVPVPGQSLRTVVLAAESGGIESQLIDLVSVFVIAAVVGVVVTKYGRFPYTVALLIAGFGASLVDIGIGIELSHDVILLVVLPPLLFEGAATTDLDVFRRNLPAIAAMAVVGLAISIAAVAAVVHFWELFGFPVLVALLFATIVLPTDPVSVLALFEELGAPERLAVLVEGESLLNDGVAVVLFSTLLVLIEESAATGAVADLGTPAGLATPAAVGDTLVQIAFVSLGGAVVGAVAGYAVYRVMATLDDHMTEIVLTVVLAYGSFLLAEHYLHVSGVIAAVAAGLLIGNRGREFAMSPQTKIAVFNTWETAAFVVNAFIFVLLGVETPIDQIVANLHLLVPAIVLVLLARALAVYPVTAVVNRLTRGPRVSLAYQHVMVWGGIHGTIPIALVLGIPSTVPGGEAPFPFRSELRVLVFGVAAFGLIVQSLTMGRLLSSLDVTTTSEETELYELLSARARAVDEALERAEGLYRDNEIHEDVYERFRTEYGREKEQLGAAIAALLDAYPELRRQELLRGEQRVLRQEESAIREAELSGQIGTDVAEELLEEVRLKQDWVEEGRTTVTSAEQREGYAEFWRERVRELDVVDPEAIGIDDEDLPPGPAGDGDAGTPMDDD